MNLLVLVHRIPYPPNKGDKIRSYNELRHLSQRHRVFLGCLADQPEDLVHVPALAALTAGLEVVPLDPRRARLRSLGAVAARDPLSVRYFASSRLQAWVDATLATQRIDAVLAFSSPMWAYVAGRDVPVVMDFCDVDSDKWRQYAERAPLPLRPLYALEARRLSAWEVEVLRQSEASVLVAERELALWNHLPAELRRKVHVIRNGVDLQFFTPRPPPAPGADTVVFTGAMDYYANVDGVDFFAREVLPRIRAQRPQARFVIVGSRPTSEVRALERLPGVTVTGFVDDVRDWYAAASVCVVPLRIARGIQNKLLEALAMGRPVVSTTAAAAGLGAGAGDGIRVAGDAEGMAATVLELLADRAGAEAQGAAGRRFVEREYDWESAMGALECLLERAAAAGGRAGGDASRPAPMPVAAPAGVA
jgi:sugar transferase (PEP-CTERM/EpsH1 system associated)